MYLADRTTSGCFARDRVTHFRPASVESDARDSGRHRAGRLFDDEVAVSVVTDVSLDHPHDDQVAFAAR